MLQQLQAPVFRGRPMKGGPKASFSIPYGLTVGGTVYVAGTFNNMIRVITAQ
jgi:hypothetical protein